VLTGTQDNEEIIERVAALDIGKAVLVCCVRVPDEDRPGRRLQEVATYSTMTGSLLGHGRPAGVPGGDPGGHGGNQRLRAA
jgi:transposase